MGTSHTKRPVDCRACCNDRCYPSFDFDLFSPPPLPLTTPHFPPLALPPPPLPPLSFPGMDDPFGPGTFSILIHNLQSQIKII